MEEIPTYYIDPGYNLREKFNTYAGMAMGVLAQIAVFRYIGFPSKTDSLTLECIAWATSTVANLYPLKRKEGSRLPIAVYGALIGAVIGVRSANKLRRKRIGF